MSGPLLYACKEATSLENKHDKRTGRDSEHSEVKPWAQVELAGWTRRLGRDRCMHLAIATNASPDGNHDNGAHEAQFL